VTRTTSACTRPDRHLGPRLDERVTRHVADSAEESASSVPTPFDLAKMRAEYARAGLAEDELAATWLEQFQNWFADAVTAGLVEPNAMVLATATPDARPSARTVLLKAVDERGFTWFTNLNSRKGTELAANPHASLVFSWPAIGRQVIAGGPVESVSREDAEAYFATRPLESRRGAWASPQSQVVADRAALEAAVAAVVERFGPDGPAEPPPHWGGQRLRPETVEFWQGRTGRLHDRLQFRRVGAAWLVERLGP
jgi:pyridoxamine 5'-phosphate oxidase